MKKETNEALEAYKIRIDALEIMNEAYLAKIEAMEMLNRNLQFLRDVKKQVGAPTVSGQSVAAPLISGEKRGRGRPRKYPVAAAVAKPALKKRGRKPKGYYDTAASENLAASPAPALASGEKRGRGRPRKFPVTEKPVVASGEKRGRGRPRKEEGAPKTASKPVARKASSKPMKSSTSITRLQVPLEAALREMLSEEGYNKATFRALTGILLCLFENGTATVTNLHEYVGGSRVTIVRHTASLKKMKLLVYEGSRKKGHYALTAQGKALHERLVNA